MSVGSFLSALATFVSRGHTVYALGFAFPGPSAILKQVMVGFAIGFLFMLWRALVKHTTCPKCVGQRLQ
jgi:hypothetical protein